MNPLIQMFEDENGGTSLMRVAVLLVVAAVLFNWVFLTVKSGTAQTLDWSQVAAVLGSLWVKAQQKKTEVSAPTQLSKSGS